LKEFKTSTAGTSPGTPTLHTSKPILRTILCTAIEEIKVRSQQIIGVGVVTLMVRYYNNTSFNVVIHVILLSSL